MYCGSMRNEAYAMLEAEMQAVTSRFSHSAALREQRAVRDVIRLHGHTEITLHKHLFAHGREVVDIVRHPLHLADIDVVSAHTDGILLLPVLLKIVLREHILAEHAPAFANIELMRPMAGIRKLVLRQSPLIHFRAQSLRARLDRCQEIEQPLRPGQMLAPDLLAAFVARLRIFPTRARQIRRDRARRC